MFCVTVIEHPEHPWQPKLLSALNVTRRHSTYQRTIVISLVRRFMMGDCKVVVLQKAKKVFRGGIGSIDSARIGLVRRNVTNFRHTSRVRA
jgi:hypothetical protein